MVMDTSIKIVICHPDTERRSQLGHNLNTLGYTIVLKCAISADLLDVVGHHNPALVISAHEMQQDFPPIAEILQERHYIPTLLLISATTKISHRILHAPGIMGTLIDTPCGTDINRLRIAIAMALSLQHTFRRHKNKVIDLRQELVDRKSIEKAAGVLMRDRDIRELDKAREHLCILADFHGLTPTEMAEAIVAHDKARQD